MSSTLHVLEHVFFVSCPRLDATDGNASSCHITLLILINNSWREERGNTDPDECLEPRAKLNHSIQLFGEQLSEKVHATIPKGIVGGFQFTVLQRNLKEWHKRPWTYVCECWRKTTKVGFTATVSGTVCWSYPKLPFGIVACTFSPTTFLKIAVYNKKS